LFIILFHSIAIMTKFLKKLFIIGLLVYPIFSIVSAADDQFAIIPDSEIEKEEL